MGTALWVSIAVVVVLVVLFVLYLWVTRNSLVTLRARVDEAWTDIAAQMRRRADLIPQLVENVTAYATTEKAEFRAVTTAREESVAASGPAESSVAENHMQQALKSIYALVEGYPQLNSSRTFLQLQGDLVDTEDKIQSSRRFYNGGVREFNAKIQVFPNSLFARRLGFGPREFFEVGDLVAVAEPPRIQF